MVQAFCYVLLLFILHDAFFETIQRLFHQQAHPFSQVKIPKEPPAFAVMSFYINLSTATITNCNSLNVQEKTRWEISLFFTCHAFSQDKSLILPFQKIDLYLSLGRIVFPDRKLLKPQNNKHYLQICVD
jgi:hypothetical protein